MAGTRAAPKNTSFGAPFPLVSLVELLKWVEERHSFDMENIQLSHDLGSGMFPVGSDWLCRGIHFILGTEMIDHKKRM